ncbi:MAG: Asp-tRNA(Asn)/Glu-tRNA(Gln) amidotransferase subunit GatC [Bryobacteraceae bacterium]|nr:Asp-tRNA(Asn)/Glu-tRNA(Gln) amidotransferase subunit GatC [Bryobacteraceae bacterium]
MKITEKEVRYVAGLANLTLTEDEIPAMAHDMDEILVYMEKLGEVDTKGVEPMAQVLFEADETATLRDDVERPDRRFTSAIATAHAPQAGQGYFKVPKVIERA